MWSTKISRLSTPSLSKRARTTPLPPTARKSAKTTTSEARNRSAAKPTKENRNRREPNERTMNMPPHAVPVGVAITTTPSILFAASVEKSDVKFKEDGL